MLRVVATMMVYNEADILSQVLDHLVDQGVYFVILDDSSGDGSVEIALSYAGKGLLEHKVVKHDTMMWGKNLDCLLEMAARHHPDWILKNDADEFLEPPQEDETLAQAIAQEDSRGYNVIQFNDFEFRLTDQDYNSNEPDIRTRLRFYTWWGDFLYTAWKYYPRTSYRESAGHFPIFPKGIETKTSPRKFVMRHYRFRTPEQALRRVFKERLPRYSRIELAKGWHHNYDTCREDPRSFIHDSSGLSYYPGSGKWEFTRGVREHPELRPYPSAEEVLLLAKIQQHSGLLSMSSIWGFLRFVRKVEDQLLPGGSKRNRVYHRLTKLAGNKIARSFHVLAHNFKIQND